MGLSTSYMYLEIKKHTTVDWITKTLTKAKGRCSARRCATGPKAYEQCLQLSDADEGTHILTLWKSVTFQHILTKKHVHDLLISIKYSFLLFEREQNTETFSEEVTSHL